MLGAHATSRTQSEWPASVSSSVQLPKPSACDQILTRPSQPPLANRRTAPPAAAAAFGPACGCCCGWTRAPGGVAGAHETALQPILCPSNMAASHVPSSLNCRTEILPSDEAQARMAPSSCGAQEIELTGRSAGARAATQRTRRVV